MQYPACTTKGATLDTTRQTIEYYETHAGEFASSTLDVDFSETQRAFTTLLHEGARILDFGCGSGRDARQFLAAGFNVTATDGSAELCRIASEAAGTPVRHERFEDLRETNAYDGIWACSSILHLPKNELAQVIIKMANALRTHGIAYASFKYGTDEGMRNGRYFTDFTEETFRAFLEAIPHLGLALERTWITQDVRPNRFHERWLNVILRKA